MEKNIIGHIEKEYKVLITEEEYLKLLANYRTTSRIQSNYYFDSNPSLKERDISIRIREISNHYYFTLKEKKAEIIEYEFEIPTFSLEHEQIKNITSNFNIKGLKLKGKLVTVRSIFRDDFGELCIDKNSYNNTVDYEVEYELFDSNTDQLKHFKDLLSVAEISYVQNNISKVARCLKKGE